MNSLQILEATTTIDRQRAYGLRFQVFVEEQGDTRYAETASRQYIDSADSGQSRILLAVDSSRAIIGTLRLTLRRDGPFLADHFYRYTDIADFFDISPDSIVERLALIDRVAVILSHRRSGVFTTLEMCVEQMLKEIKPCADILLAAVRMTNQPSNLALLRLGFIKMYDVITGPQDNDIFQHYAKLLAQK